MTIGELDRSGPRPQLRFTRALPHAPEKVWRAITEPEHRKNWFPDTVEGEFVAGAQLRFVSEYAEGGSFDGEVLQCDRPKLLEIRWGTDTLRFELQPDGTGTVLTLDRHVRRGRQGRARRRGLARVPRRPRGRARRSHPAVEAGRSLEGGTPRVRRRVRPGRFVDRPTHVTPRFLRELTPGTAVNSRQNGYGCVVCVGVPLRRRQGCSRWWRRGAVLYRGRRDRPLPPAQ